MSPGGDPMATGFHFGLPEVEMVLLATAIISAIAAIRYRHRDPRSPVASTTTPRIETSLVAPRGMGEDMREDMRESSQ